jgi:hypothetical protein
MIQDGPAVFDRGPQIAKLRTDLEVATSNAAHTGVGIAVIIRELLESAIHWREVAKDRGDSLADLAALGEYQ